MIEIGIHETKTHLSEILKKVSFGEEFFITNRGKKIALLLPFDENSKNEDEDFFSIIEKLRKKVKKSSKKKNLEIINSRRDGLL